MTYCVSDVHGEYELFLLLLEKINFSNKDTMYVCGDIIDKGKGSVRLARKIFSSKNIHCIMGNHELAFVKYYHSLLKESPDDFDGVLSKLRDYFPDDGYLLDWDLVDWLENLPSHIEEEDFICVHAGIPIDNEGKLLPVSEVDTLQLVHDRRFKEPGVKHKSPKCVFFGHTQTDCICGENKILVYRRDKNKAPKTIRDFYKIHLDTGAWTCGVLGCFCVDTLKGVYVKKDF